MRLVLDYGGAVVDHADEREYAHLLDVSPDRDPYPGWLAYFLFRAGFLILPAVRTWNYSAPVMGQPTV